MSSRLWVFQTKNLSFVCQVPATLFFNFTFINSAPSIFMQPTWKWFDLFIGKLCFPWWTTKRQWLENGRNAAEVWRWYLFTPLLVLYFMLCYLCMASTCLPLNPSNCERTRGLNCLAFSHFWTSLRNNEPTSCFVIIWNCKKLKLLPLEKDYFNVLFWICSFASYLLHAVWNYLSWRP